MIFSLIKNIVIKKGKKNSAKKIVRRIKFIFTKKYRGENFESFFLVFLRHSSLHIFSRKMFKRNLFSTYPLNRFQKIPFALSFFISQHHTKVPFYSFFFSEIDKSNSKECATYNKKISLYKSFEKNRLWLPLINE